MEKFASTTRILVGALASLLVATTASATSFASRTTYCATLFDSPAVSITTLRLDILKAGLSDRIRNRPNAWISNIIEGRAVDLKPPQQAGYQVVSLGSGPDIFLPLYLYPNAYEIHLVDTLGGWSTGPLAVVEELQERIHMLVVFAGGENGGSIERLDKQGSARHIEGFLKGPMVWRVRWNSPRTGSQEKIIYLHQANFDEPERMRALGLTNLGGVVVTGISPSTATYQFFLSLLRRDGSLFAEFWPNQADFLELIGKSYSATNHGEPGYQARFIPNVYEIRPKMYGITSDSK